MRALLLPLALIACSDSQAVDQAIGNSGQAGDPRPADSRPTATLDPGTVPVTVGEAGPRFPACQTTGLIVRTDALTVRRAPFVEAAETDRLADGRRVAVCTRSHDRRWLGIVYPAAVPAGNSDDARAMDPLATCGVARPAARRHGYDGQCRSGWVDSAFVRPIGT